MARTNCKDDGVYVVLRTEVAVDAAQLACQALLALQERLGCLLLTTLIATFEGVCVSFVYFSLGNVVRLFYLLTL